MGLGKGFSLSGLMEGDNDQERAATNSTTLLHDWFDVTPFSTLEWLGLPNKSGQTSESRWAMDDGG